MDKQIATRRRFLREVLCLSCALGSTALVAACGRDDPTNAEPSQATADRKPERPASEPPAGEMTSKPGAKVDKQTVQYQERPKGDRSCANCVHFDADSQTCALVAGDISPQGWCSLWAGKA